MMRHTPSSEQLLLFSDAVIAITITLLMLEIRLPVEADGLTDAQLASALGSIWPLFLGYGVSFFVIASFWLSHHRKFHHIVNTDGRLVWINFLFLFSIGLIPFGTALITHNGGAAGTIFYAGIFAASALSLALLWAYAWQMGLIDVGGREAAWLFYPSLMPAAVFLLSIPVAFYDADLAKYSWLLILPLAYLRRLAK